VGRIVDVVVASVVVVVDGGASVVVVAASSPSPQAATTRARHISVRAVERIAKTLDNAAGNTRFRHRLV
jgi:hypothetical protein